MEIEAVRPASRYSLMMMMICYRVLLSSQLMDMKNVRAHSMGMTASEWRMV